MSDQGDFASALCHAIADDTFPQAEDILTADLTPENITLLLTQISDARRDLSHEIDRVNQDDTGYVGQWMAEAKKAQADIAQCKLESRRIVEQHRQIQALQAEGTDHRSKIELLAAEIRFNESLQRELEVVATQTKALQEVEQFLRQQDPHAAADGLHRLDTVAAISPRAKPSVVLRDLKDELRLKTRVQLEARLHAEFQFRRDQTHAYLEVVPTSAHQASTAAGAGAVVDALAQLGEAQASLEPLTDKIRAFVLRPLRKSSHLKLLASHRRSHGLEVELGEGEPPLKLVFDFIHDFITIVRSCLSEQIQDAVAKATMADLMDTLVTDWLNPGLPTDLTMLHHLDTMQTSVNVLLDELVQAKWTGQTQLRDWLANIHRAWLSRRKASTLDAVRKAFVASRGSLRQVERVERQMVATQVDDKDTVAEESQDWDADWGDDGSTEPKPATAQTYGTDEDASGWQFDDDEDAEAQAEIRASPHETQRQAGPADHENDNAGDDWGWGDEGPEQEEDNGGNRNAEAHINGAKHPEATETEVVLTEIYSISEVPDHLVEIVGRDISDALAVQDIQHKSLDPALAAKGLLALPTLALAMFRATAPSFYGASPSLTDIHRYNDSRYIAERLRDMNVPAGMPDVAADIAAMERFARMAYSKEMETQRIIIWDLLEGAQGFTSCTQFPYSQEIANAVSAVVDRIRTLHREWQPVLSVSARLQSIGSLVTMVVGKVISSVEEMDDISEPESQRLTALCQRIAALEDLFLSTPPTRGPDAGAADQEPVPMTAVYVANWLRFQYLINILESSLVDIKYLWTEGELSLEFSADEVVDLIKALFADSAHRRSAVAAIKGARNSR